MIDSDDNSAISGSTDGALALSTESGGVEVVEELAALVERLGGLPTAADDGERIDRIAALERLRGVVAAAQARESVEFAASQVASQVAARVPASQRGRGVAEQIGYARRLSPATSARELSLAGIWMSDLPAVFAKLRTGQVSEWVARLVARETRGLSTDVRRRIAADLADDLPKMNPREAEVAARRLAYEADPAAVLARSRTARSDRRVGLRPAPDTMAVLSAFLPAEQGVAAFAALDRYARAQRAAGDPRTLGQLMADTLVERITGQATAKAIPAEIGITMTLEDLLDPESASTAAYLDGYGPLPPEFARDLAMHADSGVAVWIRRLFTDPVDDTIVHVDTRRRRFDGALARLIRYRDRVCRDPFCTAPIRHLDHVKPYREGGPTSAANGAGLCERANYVKDMPGWTTRTDPASESRTQRIEIRTPTGHSYTSTPPPALGPGGNYRERGRRAARRRFEFLRREQLIADLPKFPPQRR